MTHSYLYHRPLHFRYSIASLLLTVLLLATPLQAIDPDDSILPSISTQRKIPDTTATVGKIFIFEIPQGAYSGNISDIQVFRQNQQSLPPWLSFDSSTRMFYGIPLQDDIDTFYISVNVYLDEDEWVTSQEIFSIEVLPTLPSSSSLQGMDGFNIANIEAFRNEDSWTNFCSKEFSLYPLQCPSGFSTVQAHVHINCDVISTSPTERISIVLSVSQLLAVCPLQLTLYAENDNALAFIIAEDRAGNSMANTATLSILIHCDGSNLYPIIIQDTVQLLKGILNASILNDTLTLQAWSITSSNANYHSVVSPKRVRRQILDDLTTSSDEFMTESIPFLTSSIVPFPIRVTSLPILVVTSEIDPSDSFPSLSITVSSSPDLFISPTTSVFSSLSSLISDEFSSSLTMDMSSYSDFVSDSPISSIIDPIMTTSSDFLFPSPTLSQEIPITSDPLPSSAEPTPSIPTETLSSSSDFIITEITTSPFISDAPTPTLLSSIESSNFITSSSDFYLSSSQLLSSSEDPFSEFSTSIFESPTSSIILPSPTSLLPETSSMFEPTSTFILESSSELFESPTPTLLPETSSSILLESPTSILPETSSMFEPTSTFILESSSELFESPTPTLLPETSSSEIILEPTSTAISSSDIFESPTSSFLELFSSSEIIFEPTSSISIPIDEQTSSFISPIPSPSEVLTPIPSSTDDFLLTPSFFFSSSDEITSSNEIESSLILPFSSSSEIISELLPTSSIEEPFTTVSSIEEPFTTVSSIDEPFTTVSSIDEPFTTVSSIEVPFTTVSSIEVPFTTVSSIDEPFTTVSSIDEPFTTVSSVAEPFTTVSSIDEPFTTVSSVGEPFTTVSSIDEPFTTVSSVGEPFTTVSSIDEPFTTVSSVGEPFTTVSSIDEPFTTVSSVGEPFTTVSSIDEPFTTVSSVGEPFTTVSSIEEPFTTVSSVGEPFTTVPSIGEPFTTVSSIPEPIVSSIREPFTTVSSIEEFSTALPSIEEPFTTVSSIKEPTKSFSMDISSIVPSPTSTQPPTPSSTHGSPFTSITSELFSSSSQIPFESSEFITESFLAPFVSKIFSESPSSIFSATSIASPSFIEQSSTSISLKDASSSISEFSLNFSFQFSTSATEVTKSVEISPSSTDTSSSEAPSPSPTNNAPLLLNPIGALLVQQGVIFSHSIPDDMFYDIEDGYNLTLKLHSEVNWVGIMNQSAIIGLPLSTEIIGRYLTRYDIEIRAYDRNGEFASEVISISVNPRHGLLHDNYIEVSIDENFTIFNENVMAKVDLITKLGLPNPNDIYVYSLSSGSVVISYTNISIRNDDCMEFNNFVNAKYHSRNYTDAFKAQIDPYIPIGSLKVFGPCNRSEGTYETIQSTIGMIEPISEQLIFLAVVLPLVILACMLLIICLAVVITYRWRRLERNYILHDEQKILLNRKPIVFLDESESLSRSRRPTILAGRSKGSGYHSLVNTDSEGLDDTFTTIPEHDETVSLTDEALEFPFVEISKPLRPHAPPPYRLPPQLH